MNDYVAANFPKAKPGALPNARALAGGGAASEAAIARLVIGSRIISILTSALMALIIAALSCKSLAAGLIAAPPLTIAAIANFAVIGFAGVPINITTALIASLAVGVGIDYAIHFIDAFKREYRAVNGEGRGFPRRTFTGAGKAILISAVSVGVGFSVLALSQFRVIAQFGGLIALSMAVSAVVSLTVIPVLLTTVKPKFIYGQNSHSAAITEYRKENRRGSRGNGVADPSATV